MEQQKRSLFQYLLRESREGRGAAMLENYFQHWNTKRVDPSFGLKLFFPLKGMDFWLVSTEASRVAGYALRWMYEQKHWHALDRIVFWYALSVFLEEATHSNWVSHFLAGPDDRAAVFVGAKFGLVLWIRSPDDRPGEMGRRGPIGPGLSLVLGRRDGPVTEDELAELMAEMNPLVGFEEGQR